MSNLAIKAEPIRNAVAWKRQVLRYALQKELELGEPAIMVDPSTGDEYFVFDDHRIDLDDVIDVAAVLKKLSTLQISQMPRDEDGELDRGKARKALHALVERDATDKVAGRLREDEDAVDGVARLAQLGGALRSVAGLEAVTDAGD